MSHDGQSKLLSSINAYLKGKLEIPLRAYSWGTILNFDIRKKNVQKCHTIELLWDFITQHYGQK